MDRPVVMSIAGFDPSGGAGILADIKTIELQKAYAVAVLTANTFQNDIEVQRVDWLSTQDILSQIDILMQRWKIDWFKIGIIESYEVLQKVIAFIIGKNPTANFVWDPVLIASSGFGFVQTHNYAHTLLKNITVLTPNLPEFEQLIGSEQEALRLSENTMIYLKGGHNVDKPGQDILFFEGVKHVFEPKIMGSAKHGSGCVLASAICANFALGYPALQAFEKAKDYIEKVLSSNTSLLGWHS